VPDAENRRNAVPDQSTTVVVHRLCSNQHAKTAWQSGGQTLWKVCGPLQTINIQTIP